MWLSINPVSKTGWLLCTACLLFSSLHGDSPCLDLAMLTEKCFFNLAYD